MVALTRGPNDVRSAGDGDLDDHQPNPSRSGMHQYGLPHPYTGRGERMHRSGAGQHQPPGRLPAHRRRLRDDRRCRDHDLIGVSTVDAISDDLVPYGNRPGRTDRLTADLRHNTCCLEPQAHRQRGGRSHRTAVELPIHGVDSSCSHSYANLPHSRSVDGLLDN